LFLSKPRVHAAQLGLTGLELLEQVYQRFAFLAINSGAELGLDWSRAPL
jgi:hypothetical protein